MITPTKKATKIEIKKLPKPTFWACSRNRSPLKGGTNIQYTVSLKSIANWPTYRTKRVTNDPGFKIRLSIIYEIKIALNAQCQSCHYLIRRNLWCLCLDGDILIQFFLNHPRLEHFLESIPDYRRAG